MHLVSVHSGLCLISFCLHFNQLQFQLSVCLKKMEGECKRGSE